ncbi:MAG: hypothetical protein HYW97_00575 [Candidatus Wildermuthbacteria bacterium]|nr:hypothetical protein [Candidatus Wildermuthbacteria bacterium]
MEEQKKEKTFVVSLKGLGPFVSAIRYEKDTKDVKLFITLARETRPAVIVEDSRLGGKLSQRMFQNLEYHRSSALYISLLSEQDFTECNASEADLRNCLADLKNSSLDFSFLLVANAPLREPRGFLWTHEPHFKERVVRGFEGEAKGNWVVLRIRGDVNQAKTRILSLAAEL